jgi:hypothetical protein
MGIQVFYHPEALYHAPVIFRLRGRQTGQKGVESVPFTAFIFGVFWFNVKGDLTKISQYNFFATKCTK